MDRIYTDLHFYSGIGGTALGTAKARTVVGDATARFETIGGIEIDAAACRDFERLTGARALCVDVHDLQPAALRAWAGDRRPDMVFSSPPCKGFSRLLSAKKAAEEKYQVMNSLLERALFLCTSTWDEPPPLMFFENVPGIMSRGGDMVGRCVAQLQAAGYSVDTGNHDCGEIGNLAQRRPRWFMVARHRSRIDHVVYEPRKQRVRGCGEVIGPMPVPGDVEAGGPMHSIPKLSWTNWKRLAAIPAGGDWRDLAGTVPTGKARREVHRRHAVIPFDTAAPAVTGPGGHAADNVADPRPFSNIMVVGAWDDPARSVIGASRVGSGALSVADARVRFSNALQVVDFDEPTPTIIGQSEIQTGALSVADRRFGHVERVTPMTSPIGTVTHAPAPSSGAPAVADDRPMAWFGGVLGVGKLDEPAVTVTGGARPTTGRFAVADRPPWQRVAGVTAWTEPAPTVTSQAKIHTGAFQVADPRPFAKPPRSGAYKVMRWDAASGTVTGAGQVDNAGVAIADPRLPAWTWATADDIAAAEANPDKAPPWTPVIIAADGTWHRPLTTLELAALQSMETIVDGVPLVLDGCSHTRWRMAIGNMVPQASAEKVAEQFLAALLRSDLGTFALSTEAVWVAPVAELVA